MKKTIFMTILAILLISMVSAQQNLFPVLYGEAHNGNSTADGFTISVYPQQNETDILSDIVGETGNTQTSGYWKINLNNFKSTVQNGDVIVIKLDDGENTTLREFTLDTGNGLYSFDLNMQAAFQDYDEDGSFADVDCNDADASISPGTQEICGDGIDQDCSGADEVCTTDSTTSSGSSGGGGGRRRGSSGSNSVVICNPDWFCANWDDCTPEGQRTCLEWVDDNKCLQEYEGPATEACEYVEEVVVEEGLADQEADTQNQPSENEQDTQANTDEQENNNANQGNTENEQDENAGLTGITGQVISTVTNPTTIGAFLLIVGLLLLVVFRMRQKGSEAEYH